MKQCPACRAKMRSITESNVETDYCDHCRFVWLDHGEFDQLPTSGKVADLMSSPYLDSGNGRMDLRCPSCESDQFERLSHGRHVIHLCCRCHGILIDSTALDQILSPGQETSQQRQSGLHAVDYLEGVIEVLAAFFD